MSINAGAVCLFNCDQNGRDLPSDNEIVNYDEGKPKYKVGIAHHYFLILSSKDFNEKIHKDFSKMHHCEDKEKICEIKLCLAIPIDIIGGALDQYVYTLEEEDYIENAYNTPESATIVKKFRKRVNSVVCSKICRLNIGNCKSKKVLFYISPTGFDNILNVINKFFERGKTELKSILKEFS